MCASVRACACVRVLQKYKCFCSTRCQTHTQGTFPAPLPKKCYGWHTNPPLEGLQGNSGVPSSWKGRGKGSEDRIIDFAFWRIIHFYKNIVVFEIAFLGKKSECFFHTRKMICPIFKVFRIFFPKN